MLVGCFVETMPNHVHGLIIIDKSDDVETQYFASFRYWIYEIEASVEEQEDVFLQLAKGKISREELAKWLMGRTVHKK